MEWRLANLQGEYKQKTGKTLSIRKIAMDTGLSKTTISDIASGKIERPDKKTMDTLLIYLSVMLDRTLVTGDLWYFPPDLIVFVSDSVTVTEQIHVEITPPAAPSDAKG